MTQKRSEPARGGWLGWPRQKTQTSSGVRWRTDSSSPSSTPVQAAFVPATFSVSRVGLQNQTRTSFKWGLMVYRISIYREGAHSIANDNVKCVTGAAGRWTLMAPFCIHRRNRWRRSSSPVFSGLESFFQKWMTTNPSRAEPGARTRLIFNKRKTKDRMRFKTYVRPIVEKGTSVSSPTIRKDIDLLNSIQNSFNRKPIMRSLEL